MSQIDLYTSAMRGIHQRLDYVLSEKGVRKRERNRMLAEICGVNYETVRLWFSGATKAIPLEHLDSIAKKLDINLEWLRSGRGSMEVQAEQAAQAPEKAADVPLFEWADIESRDTAKVSRWVSAQGEQLSREAFAVQYFGEEMTGVKGQNIPDQSIVVVDPEVPPSYGMPVLARTRDGILLRNYAKAGSDVSLQAANTAYPTTPLGDGHIIGTVVFVLRFFHFNKD